MLNNRNVSFIISYLYLPFLLFLFYSKISNCQEGDIQLYGPDNIINNILKFENYQVNHFAKNNKGDFLVEFTKYTENIDVSSSRKFYGLKNDGQYFFPDEESHIKELNININTNEETSTITGLDKSKNLFVSIYDNIDNQYLFCINAYNSMVELYDINNNDNKYYIWSFNKFFGINLDNYSPFSYEIFSLKKEMAYIIAFIPKEKINSDKTSAIFIKKFRFKSFDENAYEELKSVTFEGFENKKILNLFLMDGDEDENTLVVLTCTENSGRRRNSKIIPPGDWLSLRRTETNYYFEMKCYNKELVGLKNIGLNGGYFATYYFGEELFIKSLYLNNRLVAFIYYKYDYDLIFIELLELNYKGTTS